MGCIGGSCVGCVVHRKHPHERGIEKTITQECCLICEERANSDHKGVLLHKSMSHLQRK